MYGLDSPAETTAKMEVPQCPYCKTVNVHGARVCMNCKWPIAVEEVLGRDAKAMEFFRIFVDMVAAHPVTKEEYKKLLEALG